MEQMPRHQCLVYEGAPSEQLAGIAVTLKRRLERNTRCLYLNSPPMVAGMRSALAAAGVDVAHELKKGNLVLSAEQGHLTEGSFDIDRMIDGLETAINRAIDDGYEGLWATGDMSWEFGAKKDFSKLMQYERRLEKLFHKYPALGGVCQYHRDSLPKEAVLQGLMAHPAIFVSDTLSQINPLFQPE